MLLICLFPMVHHCIYQLPQFYDILFLGYGISIQITRITTQYQQVDIPSGGSTTMKFDSTVTISNTPAPEDLSAFINKLLELLIKANIFDNKTALDLLATFSKSALLGVFIFTLNALVFRCQGYWKSNWLWNCIYG